MTPNKPCPAPDGPPDDRISAIRYSLSSFSLGLAGLIPLMGLPCAMASIVFTYKARKLSAGIWNPAGRYLRVAGWLGPLGLLIGAVVLMGLFAIHSGIRDGTLSFSSSCSTGHG